ncbi:MAG: choice-of-anchor V domain-containing protein [Deltaproteobacteria bacterium]|nr:choice-of-anchor V domain-containing protein [Deltaproteobacteria bacterium]
MIHRLAGSVTAAIVAALLGATGAFAFPAGIATTSFPVPASGCNFCHGGGLTPTVTLECTDCGGAPPAVDPLSTHEFKVTVFEIGLQDHAGFNASSVLGTLATGGGFSSVTHTVTGTGGRTEITHAAPKPSSGGITEFSFLWTAPNTNTTATLVVWGNAVNDNSSSAGDAAANVTLDVQVGDVPTPTNTPTPTPTPEVGCPASVDAACIGGFAKGMLSVQSAAGKEKLIAKLLKGPGLAQTDLGNPLVFGGTAYALCLYSGAGTLAGSVIVDRAAASCGTADCWKPIGRAPDDPQGPGSGYKYKDSGLGADGVRKLLYKGGDSAKLILVGRGASLPGGIPAALQSTASVTVQLRSSDAACLSVDLLDIRNQDASFFKAK